VHNHTGAGGQAWLTLSEDQQRLAYTIQLEQLTLKPVAADRVEPSDVFGIHLHLIVPDHPGPHILNIFGDPEEEDADLVVDYQAGRLWGVFDASDATRDPVTGELLPQFFPLTTKLIDDWIEHLMNNQLYLAIHTVGQGGGALLHGDVVLVPEPATVGLAALAAAWVLRRRGRSRRHTKFGDH
ncbi:MAG TPA: CHRD domain-containing protein, partial [Lacipirellulaceae bacterium]|nr:CHRD domain-containing protein [Lacipirellulaceae bacterium]